MVTNHWIKRTPTARGFPNRPTAPRPARPFGVGPTCNPGSSPRQPPTIGDGSSPWPTQPCSLVATSTMTTNAGWSKHCSRQADPGGSNARRRLSVTLAPRRPRGDVVAGGGSRDGRTRVCCRARPRPGMSATRIGGGPGGRFGSASSPWLLVWCSCKPRRSPALAGHRDPAAGGHRLGGDLEGDHRGGGRWENG